MEQIIFDVNKGGRLSAIIADSFSMLSYGRIQKLIREKDVKINGKRISKDIDVVVGDKIAIYLKNNENSYKIDVIYEDNNIIIVNKPRQIETVSDSGISLTSELEKQYRSVFYAVHRLDRNTSGLVVFAKNLIAKGELEKSFKNHSIKKNYLALIYGKPEYDEAKLVAYLKKDNKNSVVYVEDKKINNSYQIIKTNYKVLKSNNEYSLVQIELLTGKTHQIRAHFAHIGHFVIGDEKYGDRNINKEYNFKFQCLSAYKLSFNFNSGAKLAYLNNKIFELDKRKIDFLKVIKF